MPPGLARATGPHHPDLAPEFQYHRVMRCWRIPDGGTLVELTDAHRDPIFYRIEAGRVVRTYQRIDSSVDDWLYRQVNQIRGDRLEQVFTGESAGGATTGETSTEIDGLLPLIV